MFVLDASVIIKWFVEEDDSIKAKELMDAHVRGDITIVAPDLLISEVSNALRYNPSFSVNEVIKCIENLYDLRLDIIAPLFEITSLSINLAYERDITFYDALYIALAQELEFSYITADKKLYNKIDDLPFVNLLSKIENLDKI